MTKRYRNVMADYSYFQIIEKFKLYLKMIRTFIFDLVVIFEGYKNLTKTKVEIKASPNADIFEKVYLNHSESGMRTNQNFVFSFISVHLYDVVAPSFIFCTIISVFYFFFWTD